MRKIKFRAWDKQTGEMHEVSAVSFEEAEIRLWQTDTLTSALPWDKRIILQQFTGLHDKNGKEIYEGDIVSLALNGMELHELYKVEWSGTDARYQIWRKVSFLDLDLQIAQRHKVIGNIYENPELLK